MSSSTGHFHYSQSILCAKCWRQRLRMHRKDTKKAWTGSDSQQTIADKTNGRRRRFSCWARSAIQRIVHRSGCYFGVQNGSDSRVLVAGCALSLTESLAPQPWRHYITRFDRLWRHAWPARAVDPEKVKGGKRGKDWNWKAWGDSTFVQQLYIPYTPAFRLALRAQYYRGLRTCPAVGRRCQRGVARCVLMKISQRKTLAVSPLLHRATSLTDRATGSTTETEITIR